MPFRIQTELVAFPTDNAMYKGKVKTQIDAAKTAKDLVFVAAYNELRRLRVKMPSKEKPYLTGPVEAHLTVFYGSDKTRDSINHVIKPAVDKLVEMGVIPADTYHVVPERRQSFGGIVKKAYAVFELREL